MDDEALACGAPTDGGRPCSLPPLMKTGACHLHSDLATTQKRKVASRKNALKDGYFAKGFLGEEERARFDELGEPSDYKPRTLDAKARFLIVRAERIAASEADRNDFSPHMLSALAAVQAALDALPDEEPEEHTCMQDEDIRKKIDLLLSDPEVFLKRQPQDVAEKIRAVLREAAQGPAQAQAKASDGGEAPAPA
ncbi:MAG: hypothetical protein LC624_08080 [Halobacteriales archaeon]|nr:hypothetical protein [Halobacteriales archaeon]